MSWERQDIPTIAEEGFDQLCNQISHLATVARTLLGADPDDIVSKSIKVGQKFNVLQNEHTIMISSGGCRFIRCSNKRDKSWKYAVNPCALQNKGSGCCYCYECILENPEAVLIILSLERPRIPLWHIFFVEGEGEK